MRGVLTALTIAAALACASCAGRQAPSKGVVAKTGPDGVRIRVSMQNGRRHGSYEMFHRNGRLAVRGVYANGMRHGVFSFWREDGSLRRRLFYRRDRIVWDSASGVEPPPLSILEPIRPAPPPRIPVEVGFEIHSLAGGNRTAERVDMPAKPSARFGAGAALVVQSGIFRVAIGGDYIPSDTQLYHSYFGGLVGVQLRAPWIRDLRIAAALELGGHRVGGIGEGRYFDASPVSRWVPYQGLRAGASYAITDRFSLYTQLGGRWDRARDVFTIVEAQNPVGPIGNEIQDWEVGGSTVFGVLGLRLDVR